VAFADRTPALRRCRHPVARAADLGGTPCPANLLGQPPVLWRDSNGAARSWSIGWGTRERMVYLFASQPVAPDRCIGYCLVHATTTSTSPSA
jgi:hypothetical protein